MNTLNRTAVSIGLLLIMALLLAFMLSPPAFFDAAQNLITYGRIYLLVNQNWAVPAAGGLFLLGALWLGLVLFQRPPDKVVIQRVGRGQAELSVKTVEQAVARRLADLKTLHHLKLRVQGYEAGVIVHLSYNLQSIFNVPQAVADVNAAIREEVEGRLGVHLLDIQHKVGGAPYPASTPARRLEMEPDSLQLPSGQNIPDAQDIAQQLEEKLLSQNEIRDAKAVVKRYPEGVYVHLGLVFATNANIPAAVAQSDKLVREEIEGRLKLKVLDIRSASQIET
ncbi:MAG TPA: hypothetical protein ENK24_08635 [Anaerolineae bacterium]|nr:hypothetical protein [Anaerolineae bacterium]